MHALPWACATAVACPAAEAQVALPTLRTLPRSIRERKD